VVKVIILILSINYAWSIQMSKYQDKDGRLHHKEVTEANPFPSNNAFIYSAYGRKVGLFINIDKKALSICSMHNLRHLKEDVWPQVPTSRDEVLGLSYLGYTPSELTDTWKFAPDDYSIPPFSLSKLITQAKLLLIIQPYYKKVLGIDIKMWHFELSHRNTFWKNKLDQIYRFSFSVPIQDRYSILKWSGRFKFYLPSHLLYATTSMIDRLGKPSRLNYLKYGGEKNMKEMVGEFTQDHPISIKAGL
jgi:hypothetical protein